MFCFHQHSDIPGCNADQHNISTTILQCRSDQIPSDILFNKPVTVAIDHNQKSPVKHLRFVPFSPPPNISISRPSSVPKIIQFYSDLRVPWRWSCTLLTTSRILRHYCLKLPSVDHINIPMKQLLRRKTYVINTKKY